MRLRSRSPHGGAVVNGVPPKECDVARCFRVYVTHDQVEAMMLADRVVVMNHGGPNAAARDGSPIRLAVDLNNMHLLNEVTGAII